MHAILSPTSPEGAVGLIADVLGFDRRFWEEGLSLVHRKAQKPRATER
jgi:hypothetical protein